MDCERTTLREEDKVGPSYNGKAAAFTQSESRKRCLKFRKRILDLSQTVSALHIGSAYSCLEIADTIFFGLMRRQSNGNFQDTFLMSKGHGCLAQYTILDDLGILPKQELNRYCTRDGMLGTHPDYGTPGIEASTGSLGHGLSMAMGMAYADIIRKIDRCMYVILSDGELQEGSTWEALLIAPSRGITNLVAFVDLNDFQSLGRTSEFHPNFYPVAEKLSAFGWEAKTVDGHNVEEIYKAVTERRGDRPLIIVARTIKGKGVSFMESVPIWHYRAPSPEEYKKALAELEEKTI